VGFVIYNHLNQISGQGRGQRVLRLGFLDKIFGGKSAGTEESPKGPSARIPRRSTGFHEFTKAIQKPEGQTILDLGPTSPANIEYITQLGHRVYNEDVVSEANEKGLLMPSEVAGEQTIDVTKFLHFSLSQEAETFDAVLLWDVCDYLPEALVKPFIERIHRVTKPQGLLLGFFHTKDAGPNAPYYRYHMKDTQTLELQEGPKFRLQRVFNNRHIENLFHDYTNLKFFLGKDNVREVLIVR
jgi:SAM-dependent methyltransferase